MDPPALLEEAARIAADSDGAAPAGDAVPVEGQGDAGTAAPAAAPTPQDIDASTAKLAPLVAIAVQSVAGIAAPAWEVTPEECADLGGALAAVLAHWFPNAAPTDPKWASLLALAMVAATIAGKRRTADGWKPLRVEAKARPTVDGQRGRPVQSVNELAI